MIEKEQQTKEDSINNLCSHEKNYVLLDGNTRLPSNWKYQVVFVDEYNNWYLVGFFNDLKAAEPEVREYLSGYEFEDCDANAENSPERQAELLEEASHLAEYPSTFCSCFDKIIDTTCGYVEIRGFIFN